MSLSRECAAALLSFRYPSTRYIYLSRSTDTARESCFWVVFIKEMWFFLLCGWAIIVNCWYSEWAWSERQRGSSLIELGALNTFLRNARNCDSGKIKGARNCGYARMAELSCAVVWFCALSLSCIVVACTKVSDSFLLCIAILLTLLLSFLVSFINSSL